MGVKSTVCLTREDAEAKLLAMIPSLIRLSNSDLEDILMLLNDQQHGGEGYENYQIVPDWALNQE